MASLSIQVFPVFGRNQEKRAVRFFVSSLNSNRAALVSRAAGAILCAALFLGVVSKDVAAQDTAAAQLDIGPSGKAYLEAVGRRVNSDVGYFDPNAARPELDVKQPIDREIAPQKRHEDIWDVLADISPYVERWHVQLIFWLLLAGLVYLIVRNSGGLNVSLRVAPRDAHRQSGAAPKPQADTPDVPQSLQAILGQKDRSLALIAMVHALLSHLSEQSGILRQRSWTARDTLRRLPGDQSYSAALRKMILASERAQFGNHSVSEEEFARHLAVARPLLGRSST